eukprot:GHUV01020660.1.p1 GENE.GHUV01020660.1~~GHUV01020660.1.p1  ORF type:complete len:102 (+),score=28.02 GHUV01020660.1:819-1124(+)
MVILQALDNMLAVVTTSIWCTCCLQLMSTISSEGASWLIRTYKSLTAAAVEVGDSRMYAGLHFPSANADGLKLGRLLASSVFDKITSRGVSVRSADGTATL